jgi:archaellum component FlaF (FlaF/FlaG flagellin family)
LVNESSASATLVNVTARGSGALNQDVGIENLTNATMTVRDSFADGTHISILNNGSTVRVANSRLGSVAQGTMTCINAYLADTFALLNASCQ